MGVHARCYWTPLVQGPRVMGAGVPRYWSPGSLDTMEGCAPWPALLDTVRPGEPSGKCRRPVGTRWMNVSREERHKTSEFNSYDWMIQYCTQRSLRFPAETRFLVIAKNVKSKEVQILLPPQHWV